MLQSKNLRIDEISNLEKSILTELQTIELNTSPEPVRFETLSPEPSLTSQTGGKLKKWQTRKHKSSRKNKSTRKHKSNHR
jgi:hypothetical protein